MWQILITPFSFVMWLSGIGSRSNQHGHIWHTSEGRYQKSHLSPLWYWWIRPLFMYCLHQNQVRAVMLYWASSFKRIIFHGPTMPILCSLQKVIFAKRPTCVGQWVKALQYLQPTLLLCLLARFSWGALSCHGVTYLCRLYESACVCCCAVSRWEMVAVSRAKRAGNEHATEMQENL